MNATFEIEVKAKVYGQFLDTEEVKEKFSPRVSRRNMALLGSLILGVFIIRNIINVFVLFNSLCVVIIIVVTTDNLLETNRFRVTRNQSLSVTAS